MATAAATAVVGADSLLLSGQLPTADSAGPMPVCHAIVPWRPARPQPPASEHLPSGSLAVHPQCSVRSTRPPAVSASARANAITSGHVPATLQSPPPSQSASKLSGLLMNFPKRSQAYPIACGPCWSPLGGWAGWYGWLGCGDHKFSCPYLSKCPGARFAFS